MHRRTKSAATAATALAVALGVVAAPSGASKHHGYHPSKHHKFDTTLKLTPSSPQLAGCMPKARVRIGVDETVDQVGFDSFTVDAKGLPPKTTFTVFLLEQAGSPFGAAEYIGDFTSDRKGRSHNTFRLIVSEAFSSTLVDGKRVRVDLNQVGAWFADPAGDDFCLGKGGGAVTPFDGDDEAGVQAFNSANTTPLPAP